MLAGPNLALVSRRQMLPNQPCNFFWVADAIVIDGLVRSDNRGSESFFPLYQYADATPAKEPDGSHRRSNFSSQFLDAVQRTLSLTWSEGTSSGTRRVFAERDLLNYIYALFHAPSYRSRYATWLQLDFPRIPLPRSLGLFRQMAKLGGLLMSLHLAAGHHTEARGNVEHQPVPPLTLVPRSAQSRPGARTQTAYPRFRDGQLLVDENLQMQGVSRDVWEYRVGGYQVCRKWLRDRRGRSLTQDDRSTFEWIVAAVQESMRRMAEIDAGIERCGGWPAAFTSSSN
jgi:predicted helicase